MQGREESEFALFVTRSPLFLSENLGRERFNNGSLPPFVRGKSSFAAGLGQEGFTIPMMFERYLRQEKSAISIQTDQ